MAFDPEFLAMMPDRLVLEPLTGETTRGDPSYGPAVERPMRIEENLETLRRMGISEVQFDTVAFVAPYRWNAGTSSWDPDPAAAIDGEDRVTLPDGRHPPIQSVAAERDDEGLHHFTVVFGQAGGAVQ